MATNPDLVLDAFSVPSGEPAWRADARRDALGRFRALGLPTTKDEDWRFTSLAPVAPLLVAPVRPGEGRGAEPLLTLASSSDAARLVFVNGRLRPALSRTAGLPPGAFLGGLSEALRDIPERVRPHLGRLARPESHAFVALNAALGDDAAVLWIPRDTTIDAPVEIVYLSDAPGRAALASPRTLVVAGEGARAIIAEIFVGRSEEPYVTNAVAEVVLADGARVEHYRIQDEAARAFHMGVLAVEAGAEGHFSTHSLALGAALSRSEVHGRLGGERGEIALSGLYMAGGHQHVDNLSVVEHAVPRCTTTENYKGILDGHARGVFTGRIRVMPGAQKTNAHQMNSNLLLSDDAIVDTKPQLEILADDVKCGHGGTVGQLDEAALFYLRSRGLAEAEARGLLVYAFASEMVELVRPTALRARVKELVSARLPAAARLPEAA